MMTKYLNLKMMKTALTEIILKRIIPKIKEGVSKGVFLDPDDCEDLIRVLSISVSLEEIMQFCSELIQNPLITKGEDRNNDNTTNSE
jgi:hypothetical protein